MNSQSRLSTPARRALSVLGDAWSLWILRHAFRGARRYSEWKERLPIPDAVLSDRLRRLVEARVFAKAPGATAARANYRLTKQGLELYALLVAIWNWESTWVPHPSRHAYPDMVHLACGHTTRPVLACAHCLRPAGARDTVLDRRSQAGAAGVWAAEGPRYRRSGVVARGDRRMPKWQIMDIIGDRWGNALIGGLFLGLHAFDEFERELSIPPAMLADRLVKFTRLGLVRRSPNEMDARRRFYRLTEKGLSLYPVTVLLVDWGNRWLSARSETFGVRHRACGRSFKPLLLCARCEGPLSRTDIRFQP